MGDIAFLPSIGNKSSFDFVASPIGRRILKIKRKPGHEIDFDLLKKKFISKNGKIMGCGLTIFPK